MDPISAWPIHGNFNKNHLITHEKPMRKLSLGAFPWRPGVDLYKVVSGQQRTACLGPALKLPWAIPKTGWLISWKIPIDNG